MILLLAVIAWILVLWLVVGLCAAARAGERSAHTRASVASQQPAPVGWEPLHLEIAAHAHVRSARPAEPAGTLMRSGGVAA